MIRPRRFAAALLLAAALTSMSSPAFAATPPPAGSDLTVSVPTASPTPTPTPVPTTPITVVPPAQAPPAVTPPAPAAPAAGSSGRAAAAGGGTASPAAGGAASTPDAGLGTAPSTTANRATTDRLHYALGDSVTVSMRGFTPGEQVQVALFSEPRLIATVPAGADGAFSHTFPLPDDLLVGSHTIQLTGADSKLVATAEIFVTATAASSISDLQGVPWWVWWVAAGLGAVALVLGVWWLVRVMRAPAVAGATA